jgi:hypothetical protein
MLATAWLAASPATGSPDEGAHYLRALAAASGQLTGDPPPAPQPAETLNEKYMRRTSRTFSLPNRLLPPPTLICTANHPELAASCQDNWGTSPTPGGSSRQVSYVGTYQPYLYFLPGLFARAGRSFRSGILLGRAANVLLTIVLVGLAAALVWDRQSRSVALIGLLVAITPMGLFMFASLNTNGPEIAGGLCLVAGLLALTRRISSPPWIWFSTAAGGVVLSLGRGIGPGYVVLVVVVAVLFTGLRGLRERAHAAGWAALLAVAAVVAAMAAGEGWELAMHPHRTDPLSDAIHHVLPTIMALPDQFHQQIGVFGWFDTTMPRVVYTTWAVLVTLLLGLAYLVGTRRQRLALTAAIATYVGGTIFLGAIVLPPTGFGLQGRYILPLAVVVPLVAGEIVRLNFHRLGAVRPHHLPLMFGVAVAVLQGVGWWSDARRYAVSARGPIFFFGRSQWSPVAGWAPWTILAMGGVVLLAVAGAQFEKESRPAGSTQLQTVIAE